MPSGSISYVDKLTGQRKTINMADVQKPAPMPQTAEPYNSPTASGWWDEQSRTGQLQGTTAADIFDSEPEAPSMAPVQTAADIFDSEPDEAPQPSWWDKTKEVVSQIGSPVYQAGKVISKVKENLPSMQTVGETFLKPLEAMGITDPEAQVQALEPAYRQVKATARGITMGASDVLLNQAEKYLGADIAPPNSTAESVANNVGTLLGGIFTGVGMAQGIGGLVAKAGITGAKAALATRLGTAVIQSGTTAVNNILAGNRNKKEATGDFAQSFGAALVGLATSLVHGGDAKQKALNFIAQTGGDFLYDLTTDVGIRDRLKDQSFKDWFIQEELPQLIGSFTFAIKDAADPNFERDRKRIIADWKGEHAPEKVIQKFNTTEPTPPPLPEQPPLLPKGPLEYDQEAAQMRYPEKAASPLDTAQKGQPVTMENGSQAVRLGEPLPAPKPVAEATPEQIQAFRRDANARLYLTQAQGNEAEATKMWLEDNPPPAPTTPPVAEPAPQKASEPPAKPVDPVKPAPETAKPTERETVKERVAKAKGREIIKGQKAIDQIKADPKLYQPKLSIGDKTADGTIIDIQIDPTGYINPSVNYVIKQRNGQTFTTFAISADKNVQRYQPTPQPSDLTKATGETTKPTTGYAEGQDVAMNTSFGVGKRGKIVKVDTSDPDTTYYDVQVGDKVESNLTSEDFKPAKTSTQAIKERVAKAKMTSAQRDAANAEKALAADAEKKEAIAKEQSKEPSFKRKRGVFSKTGAIGVEPDATLSSKQMTTPISKEAIAVEKMYEKQDQDIRARFKMNREKVKDIIGSSIVAADEPIQRKLAQASGGEDVLLARGKLRGASAKAKQLFEDYENEIATSLPANMDKNFGRILQSNRTIEATKLVNERRGRQPELGIDVPDTLQNTGGMTPKYHQAYLDAIKQQYPKEWPAVENAMKKRYELNDKLVDSMLEHGLIDKEFSKYLKENHRNYSPRWFIDKIDPDTGMTIGQGKPVSVPDSGIKRLQEGSTGAQISNWRTLLADQINRVESRIAKNDSNKSLYDWVKKNPENILGTKIAKSSEDVVPDGYEGVRVMIDGKPETMLMPSEAAKYWVKSDPELSRRASEFIQWASGAKILKSTATGAFAPEFALTNISMDFLYKWFGGIGQYSSFAPKFVMQAMSDYKAVAKSPETFNRKVREYINEYGGMDFLSQQGLTEGRAPWEAGVSAHSESVKQAEHVMTYLSNKSEMWGRLAMRERALRNITSKRGAKPEDATAEERFKATQIARNTLDFSQGGSIVKMLDTGFAYLNAGTQAGRGLIRAFINEPVKAMLQAGQLIAIAAGMNYALRKHADDFYEKLTPRDREGYWTIPLFKTKDSAGNDQWVYTKIRKDQSARLFTAIGDTIADKFAGKEVDLSQIKMAMSDLSPIGGVSSLIPPSVSALATYFLKKDFWNNRDVWKGESVDPEYEVTSDTPEWMDKAAKGLAKIGVHISPERVRAMSRRVVAPNIYTAMASGIGNMMLPEDEKVRKSMWEDLSSRPLFRKVIGITKTYDITPTQERLIKTYDIPTETDSGKPRPVAEIKKEAYQKETERNNMQAKNNVALEKMALKAKINPAKKQEIINFLDKVFEDDTKEGKRLEARVYDKYKLEI